MDLHKILAQVSNFENKKTFMLPTMIYKQKDTFIVGVQQEEP
jgi:hypothetical protein